MILRGLTIGAFTYVACIIPPMLNALMIVLAMVVASCLISTMALFMGGGQAGADLRDLMLLQLISIPVAMVAIVMAVSSYNVKRLYATVPQWMAFGFFLLLLLVASGEVAFLIVSRAADVEVAWTAHAPLLSMFFCSLAICALYAYAGIRAGRPNPTSGRW